MHLIGGGRMNRSKKIDKIVIVQRTTPKTLRNDVEKNLTESNLDAFDLDHLTLIKINGNYDRNYPGSDTSSWFLDALLKGLQKYGFKKLKVVEGDGYLYTAERMIQNTGLLKICEKNNVPFMSYERLPRDEHELPLILKESQLFNVPVFHTHGFAIVSCATKNLFGLLPKSREKYHEGLSEKLLELYNLVKPFTIVDGTVGMKGDSTRRGDPVRLDLIAMGWDTLSIDAIASKIMGYSFEDIPLLKLALEKKFLYHPIEVSGDFKWETLPEYDFNFGYSRPKKLSLWLHSHKSTKAVIEKKGIKKIFHFLRGTYETYTYYKKKDKIFNGPWMEYKTINDNESNEGENI